MYVCLLFDNAGEWFRNPVGVREGCMVSMIAGRTNSNLRFADDIDGLAGREQELGHLAERLDQTSDSYNMETSAEKTKSNDNNINGIHKEIMASGQKLQTVTNFKYSLPVMGGQPPARERIFFPRRVPTESLSSVVG